MKAGSAYARVLLRKTKNKTLKRNVNNYDLIKNLKQNIECTGSHRNNYDLKLPALLGRFSTSHEIFNVRPVTRGQMNRTTKKYGASFQSRFFSTELTTNPKSDRPHYLQCSSKGSSEK
ncbi:hypothetical protein ACFX13_031447 [Malus domestica]